MRVVTYNLGDGPDDAKRRDLLKLSAAGADVICLQEAGDRQRLLADWAAEFGWELWTGDVEGSSSVPILHRIPAVHRFSRLAVPEKNVGPGKGPDRAKAKAINGIRVGRTVILNTHFIASAQGQGPDGLRYKHYQLHMAVLHDTIERRLQRGLAVASLGDFNATDEFELLKPLWKLGLRNQVTEPTHEGRSIDKCLTHALKAPVSVVIRDLSSDHDAPFVTVKEAA